MRIFKSRKFARFARKEGIDDDVLRKSILDADRGLIDADYGGGVIKQRIARDNKGKSGGYRSIVLFRRRERSFFVYGFAKNDKANIDESDARNFKSLAGILLGASEHEMQNLLDRGEFFEVNT